MPAKNLDQFPPGLKVLVAEDNEAVRAFILRALEPYPLQVKGVSNGQEALDALAVAPFDVLISDIMMPIVDGITLALKAVRQYPDLKIVMISGYAQERMRAHNLDALVHRIVAKPFAPEEIAEAIQDALETPSASGLNKSPFDKGV